MQEQICTLSIPQKPSHSPHPSSDLFSKCDQISNEIIRKQLERVARDIYTILRQSIGSGLSTRAHIFSLQLKRYQQQYLVPFLAILDSKELEHFERVKLISSDVRSIANEIDEYFLYADMSLSYLFYAPQITNLSSNNLYILQYLPLTSNCYLLLPTYATVQDENTVKLDCQQFTLFNNKQLFCRFFYECMVQIQAYYPKQLLQFLSDFDYYPIPYQEAVRRFKVCLGEMNRVGKKAASKWNIKPIVECLDSVYRSMIVGFKYQRSIHLMNVIRALLDKDQKYKFSEKYYMNYSGLTKDPMLDREENREEVILRFRERLVKEMEKNESLQHYVQILNEEPVVKKKEVNRKKSRSDQFGITSTVKKTEKEKLQLQITTILHSATENLRLQAATIKYQKFKFNEKIQPQIGRILFEQAYKLKGFKEVLSQLRQYLSVPLSVLVMRFSSRVPQLAYILNTLQITGMIQMDRKNAKPFVSINFYDKANFTLMKE